MNFLKKENYTKYIILFILTFLTCTMAGAQWAYKDYLEVTNWQYGLTYAILILTFLSVHEFGHYFAARHHKVHTTLPYYIPFPVPILLNFGTFGAVIRIKQPIPSKKALFDIGITGPIAGYIVSVIFLIIGFIFLPTKADILAIHPEYITQFGGNIPDTGLHFGNTLLFSFLSKILVPNGHFIPPMNELYHFPFLNVGWFGLFVTTMNLLPIGQLDGGHILYSMFGSKIHLKVAKTTMWILIILGSIGSVNEVYYFMQQPFTSDFMLSIQSLVLDNLGPIYTKYPILQEFWSGWLLWALIGKFFIKLPHPIAQHEEPISKQRMMLGWFALFMLISSFSINAIFFR
ncbi:MAG: hypothetical protein A2X64_08810 [Ignavibacteria bacterium GWF2_33_9]|nr:MAG: hypothetical protein A2X64_08810 [Ignavibacteria bacterium GWF2_33_9]